MSTPMFPIRELAKRLEGCDDAEFVTLLRSLRSPSFVDERLLKSDLSLLATKTLGLLRSSQDATIWRGCHTAVVVCSYNPLMLCAHAGQFLAAVHSKLDHKVEYYSSAVQTPQSAVLLQTLVSSLGGLINLMRGKPTLSREGLVPQLKVVIPVLVKLAQVEPKLALPVLKILLRKNTTTFRPFANRFRAVLSELLTKEYEHCDKETQRLICDNFAYLHLIKLAPSNGDDEAQAHHKSYQDDTWKMGIFSVLSKFKPILELCGEFLDLEQDKEVQKLIHGLALREESGKLADFLPGLKLDMNSPLTLWEAPRRLSLLLDLLTSFMTLSTPYPVRIPLGFCISVAEGLLSMTNNYLPIKRDVRRDSELTSVILDVLPQIQFVGVRLLSVISATYGKLCLAMLPSILGSLELFIPLQQKSSKIDFEKCASLRYEFMTVFKLISSLMSHMGHHLNEIELIKKLVDVALHLTEGQSALDLTPSQEAVRSKENNSKSKQRKENTSTSISDIYVQPESFNFDCPESLLRDINHFLQAMMSNWKLPSAENLKILKYTLSAALRWKERKGYVPESYVRLLRAEVMNPGAERVSILPMAISLLKNTNDDVFDLLCHPRLPMSLVHNVKASTEITEEAVEEQSEYTTGEARENHSGRPFTAGIDINSIVEKIENPEQKSYDASKGNDIIVSENVVEVQPSQETPLIKKRELEEETVSSDVSKRTKVSADEIKTITEVEEAVTIQTTTASIPDQSAVESKTVELVTVSEKDASDDDSDFEMPTINVSGDEDEEEGTDEE